jgi:Domain of unknown function (DUF1841)
MPVFDTQSRDQLRRSYAEAWAKHLAGSPLSPLEAMICDVIGLHPEYQRIVADPISAATFEPNAHGDADNPFLHMGLHIAVREQLSVDRPPGIRDLHRQLQLQQGGVHDAEHVLMESLGQTLWQAQRDGVAPDAERYLALARERVVKR